MKKAIALMILSFLAVSLLALPEHKPGEVVVKFTTEYRNSIDFQVSEGQVLSGIPSLDGVLKNYGMTDYYQLIPEYDHNQNTDYGLDMIYVFSSQSDQNAVNSIPAFERLGIVEYAELNYRIKFFSETGNNQTGWEPFFIPNDPSLGQQWFLAKISAEKAWDLYTGNNNMVVSVIDDGCEKDHADLAANYVTGYDYVNNDNDPTPPTANDNHGTHCCGLAAAVTNNGTGIAAVSFNVGLIGVRTYYCTQCTQGIYFSSQNGANVISMSWSCPYSSTMLSAVNDAYVNYDVLLFGASGNDNWSIIQYPAGYGNVSAVAASNGSDIKANFSNFGTWIDITAPGTGMYSTVPFGSYAYMDGTSMSTPLVAGLATYIRDFDTTLTNAATLSILQDACEPMNDTFYTAGLLGAGRINAYRSIGKAGFTGLLPVAIDVTGPGGSCHILPGEQGSIVIDLACDTAFNSATNVSVDANSTSGIITFNNSSGDFSNANPGDTVDNSADPITFTVDGGASTEFVTVCFTINSDPATAVDTFSVTFTAGGIPEICVVNADPAGQYISNYTTPLSDLGYLYDCYPRWSDGPMGSLINDYSMVIWYSGDATANVLTNDDINDLSSYLGSGKDLFITGQNIAEDLDGNSFLSDYLKVTYSGNATTSVHDGISGSIFEGLMIATAGGSPANQTSRDILVPGTNAQQAFIYHGGSDVAAIQYFGGYKLVFFGFGFEAIHENGPFVSRDTVLVRILDWFETGVEEQPLENPVLGSELSLSVKGSSVFLNRISFAVNVPEQQSADVHIYDMTGRRVITLGSNLQSGNYQLSWDGKDTMGRSLSGGNYIVKVISNNQSDFQRILFIR
ncbi:MAG: S8 family serine peptidase [bacterium]